MKLTDKTILIVGASSGIGRAVALKLARNNNRLILAARRQHELITLAEEIEQNGSQALALPCDALDEAQAKTTIEQAVQHFGDLDVVLLNVGDGPSFNMQTTDATAIKHNMALNYDSLVNFLPALIAQMKDKPGRHGDKKLIAHTNSLAGFLGLPMQGPYSAAKAAARILMDTCRLELKDSGIHFVSLYPGFVATERVAEDGIPAPLEISEQQAADHMIRGMETALKNGRADYLFPASTKWLIRLALVLPKRITGWLLLKATPEQY